VAARLEDWYAVGQFLSPLPDYIVFFCKPNLILCVYYLVNKYCWLDL